MGARETLLHELAIGLTAAARDVETVNRLNGWYDDTRTFAEDIALLHSEVSEALEAFRFWGLDDVTGRLCPQTNHGQAEPHLCKPEGVGSELADVFIRLLDTCTRRGIDLAVEFDRKHHYNITRGHRHGGKRL